MIQVTEKRMKFIMASIHLESNIYKGQKFSNKLKNVKYTVWTKVSLASIIKVTQSTLTYVGRQQITIFYAIA